MSRAPHLVAGTLALSERLPPAARRAQAFRRFLITAGDPVPLLAQLDAVSLAHENARGNLRRMLRGGLEHGGEVHRSMVRHTDALRAARATLARFVEAEVAHLGAALPDADRKAVDDAITTAPNLLELEGRR